MVDCDLEVQNLITSRAALAEPPPSAHTPRAGAALVEPHTVSLSPRGCVSAYE